MKSFKRFLLAGISFVGVLALSACDGGDSYTPPPVSNSLGSLTYTTTLTGAQQSPPALTAASGTGTFTINASTGDFSGTIVTVGMTGNAANVRLGSAGVSGPIVIPMTETSAGSGTWTVSGVTLSSDLRLALGGGSLYANVQSVSFPSGQLRGQIGMITRTATLTGSQENPGTGSSATGTAVLSVEPSSRTLTARLVTIGVPGIAAHIHNGAIGVNAPVIVPLAETTAGSGIWVSAAGATLTAAQFQDMLAGNLYFNVHSPASPGGESRGQIGVEVIDVTLAADQEVPPTGSVETANLRLLVNPITMVASGTITTTVPATAAHIHTGLFGVIGPVTLPFTKSATNSAVWVMPDTTLTLAQYRSLLFGDMYVNVHSATFPGGELRGQIGKVIRTANLSGANEVPPNASTATGRARADFDPITKSFVVNMTTTGIAVAAAHIHTGALGSNGPVTVPFTQNAAGVWVAAPTAKLSAAQAATFAADGMYYNAHSAAFPGGEIRAQATGRD